MDDATHRESPTRERTRNAILIAAIEVLGKDPGASLGKIAAGAGVARSSLHRYFPDRPALTAGIEELVSATYQQAFHAARITDGTGADALRRAITELLERFHILTWWLDSDDDSVDAQLEEVVDRGHADGSIDPLVSAAWLESMLWSCLWSTAQIVETGEQSAHDARELCIHTFMKIVTPTGHRPAETGRIGQVAR